MSVRTLPMWRLRLSRGIARYAACALCVCGIAASARMAIAPPSPARSTADAEAAYVTDRAAEGYATLFARRYLEWNGSEPEAHERALVPFLGPQADGEAVGIPEAGTEHVAWAEVVESRTTTPGAHVYTVAVETDAAGLLYLAVSIERGSGGALAIAGYPAFVGPPTSAVGRLAATGREVVDTELETVVGRVLNNYLSGSATDLAADLAPGARVSPPMQALQLTSMQRVAWSAAGSAVVAVVEAQDSRGARYTLAYELDVVRQQGRWEVSAVEMDPAG